MILWNNIHTVPHKQFSWNAIGCHYMNLELHFLITFTSLKINLLSVGLFPFCISDTTRQTSPVAFQWLTYDCVYTSKLHVPGNTPRHWLAEKSCNLLRSPKQSGPMQKDLWERPLQHPLLQYHTWELLGGTLAGTCQNHTREYFSSLAVLQTMY